MNTTPLIVSAQGRRMAFTSHLPPSIATIPPRTLVEARGVNGDLVASWNCSRGCSQTIASLGFVIKVSAILNVPRKAIHLLWDPVTLAVNDGFQDNPDIGASGCPLLKNIHHVNVKVLLNQLERDDGDLEPTNDPECCCCDDPCENADYDGKRTRDENCYRCAPDCMCESCRVPIPARGWVWFLCLEETEQVFLNHAQLRRYNLVRSQWAD